MNPGPTTSDSIPEAMAQGYADKVLLPGFRKAIASQDIAKAVAFLASDDARFITATNLTVAGGAFHVI